MEKLNPKRRWFRFTLRTLFIVVTVFAIFGGADAADPKAPNAPNRRDADAVLRLLQGTWVVSSAESYGRPDEQSIGREIAFQGDKYFEPPGKIWATFKIDSRQDPMHLEFNTVKGMGTTRGVAIFAVDEKSLTICHTIAWGHRPASFDGATARLFKYTRKQETKH